MASSGDSTTPQNSLVVAADSMTLFPYRQILSVVGGRIELKHKGAAKDANTMHEGTQPSSKITQQP